MIEKIEAYRDTMGKLHETKAKAVDASARDIIETWLMEAYQGDFKILFDKKVSKRRATRLMWAFQELFDHDFNIRMDTCADGQLPDGPMCPACDGKREPSGIDGGKWVHV